MNRKSTLVNEMARQAIVLTDDGLTNGLLDASEGFNAFR